jgi:DNA-binding transcriptional regulator PaaX
MHLSELYKKDMIPKGVSISSQILTFLKKHPSSTSFLIKQKILPSGVDYQTENLVSKALTRLKAAGEIRTTGEKRRYRYSLTNITVHKLES